MVVKDNLVHRSLDLISIFPQGQAAKAYICPHTQEVDTNKDDEDIHDGSDPTSQAPNLVEIGAVVGSPHPEVGNAPEDPAEEGIEQGTH